MRATHGSPLASTFAAFPSTASLRRGAGSQNYPNLSMKPINQTAHQQTPQTRRAPCWHHGPRCLCPACAPEAALSLERSVWTVCRVVHYTSVSQVSRSYGFIDLHVPQTSPQSTDWSHLVWTSFSDRPFPFGPELSHFHAWRKCSDPHLNVACIWKCL